MIKYPSNQLFLAGSMGVRYRRFIVLSILYEDYKIDGVPKDIHIDRVLNDPDLSYLGKSSVLAEVQYLGGKQFIIGSVSGQRHFTWVKISSTGIDIMEFIIDQLPKYVNDMGTEEGKQLYNQVNAMTNEEGIRKQISGFIKKNIGIFEDFAEKTNAISDNRVPYDKAKPLGGGPQIHVYMNAGDVFQGIQNSTIVNKSIVQDAFNKFSNDKEAGQAFANLAKFIHDSGDSAAGTLFNDFSKEMSNPTPDKSRLKRAWDVIVQLLPAVTSVAGVATHIIPLFS